MNTFFLSPCHSLEMRLHSLLFVFFLYVVAQTNLYAQKQFTPKSGYIGIGLGPSYLVGGNKIYQGSGTGLNVTLLNAGYTFYKGFGVNANWSGAAFVYDTENQHNDTQGNFHSDKSHHEVSLGTLMVGPMYALDLSETSRLDFKGRLGRFYMQDKSSSSFGELTYESSALSWSLGTTYQKRIGQWVALAISADYHKGRSWEESGDRGVGLVNLSAGIAFLL
ncbi:hypothetical protein ACD591_13540 [Rufibacter glacialis]|uniref:Outer membrane beta-barrel protein n=1 Tax=Rufibacter glacialis TaxID=1259555 RepID=A0A5M8Q983_9BACT|nr:hypothetical protein [Rufibacter glacialis]KAA6431122.1 hypothetical protein FOE74_18685 [Rufibacter glacialis]